ncbi:MAG TPA: DUF305 domain-containing protein [Gemmatimonadaceae bacterium]
MTAPSRSFLVPGLVAALSLTAFVTAAAQGGNASQAAAVQTGKPQPNPADVHFMSGMIPHHAQAVLIAGWAPSHGASTPVRLLCERIVVAQRDEIALMSTWLRDRGLPVPDSNATHLRMNMNGMQHDMLMPGMLNPEELAELDKARGVDFDRLFLQAMIKHHGGAISMVEALTSSQGAALDEVVFRFSSDVYADQTTEIERMEKMLAALPAPKNAP